jgi:hypothetical protein
MRAQRDSTLSSGGVPEVSGEKVTIFVPDTHPLMKLQQTLDWAALRAVMIHHWRAAGKNVDGRRGQKWPVGLYVPVVVLMLVKVWHARAMEEYLNESVVARRFCGLSEQLELQVRDHANIARALAGLGAEGVEAVNQLVIKQAQALGFTTPEILSSDTTVQEPRIGYPHEPGILKGLAERCERALKKLKKHGVRAARGAIETTKAIYRNVKAHHLWAKTKEERQEIVTRLVKQTEELTAQTAQLTQAVKTGGDRVKEQAVAKLQRMGEVAKQLGPQITGWIATGWVATEKIIHAGLPEARAIVTNKAGHRVRFGMKWLLHRLRGGYLFGRRVAARASEDKMPLESLKDYRTLFGDSATPTMQVYDRGGSYPQTIAKLQAEKVRKIGILPRGQMEWLVGAKDQKVVKSERGKTEGSLGRLKHQKYGFSGRQERSHQTQTAAGQRAIVSANLNTLLRDLVRKEPDSRHA